MSFNGKNVLIIGLARTGLSTLKKLNDRGVKVSINDSKKEEELNDILKEVRKIGDFDLILGDRPNKLDEYDTMIVSPGVPLDLDFVREFKSMGKRVIGEIELAYELNNRPRILGITGTNGKTTTTSLTGEILKKAGKDVYIVGNIGSPVIDVIDKADENSYLVTELSSFQLESIESYKPYASSILNITPDHLNRHHTMENYMEAKYNVFRNQDENNYCILNYDDEELKKLNNRVKANILWFSVKEKVEGVYLDGDEIVVNLPGQDEYVICKFSEISLPGLHNLNNNMAAILFALVCDIDRDVITNVIKNFKAVEHRLEYVDEIGGVKFVNDSKGTNPDSTIKAVNAYDNPLILIAGGYDKESNFDELMSEAKRNVKKIVTLGQTSDQIEESARKNGINDVVHVENMAQAVKIAYDSAVKGDTVLLSPACASWGMYNNYEERGVDFKDNVARIKSTGK